MRAHGQAPPTTASSHGNELRELQSELEEERNKRIDDAREILDLKMQLKQAQDKGVSYEGGVMLLLLLLLPQVGMIVAVVCF